MRISIIFTLIKYYWGDKIKEDEMGRVFGMHAEKCTEFWWGNLNEREHWEGLGIEGGIIIKISLKDVALEGIE